MTTTTRRGGRSKDNFDFIQHEQGDVMIKQFCRNAVLYDVYEYPFKESQVGGIQNTVDFMLSIDSEYFPKAHTFTEGVDYHINSIIIKHHLFIGIDLENDTTHEKSHVTIIFCPMAHAASNKLREGFKEIYEHTQDGLNKRGGKAMMFLISNKMFHKCICASHSQQELIVNIQKQDALGEMHAMSVDAKLISIFQVMISFFELMPPTDAFIGNLNIDGCIFCQRYKKILEPLAMKVNDMELPKAFRDDLDKMVKDVQNVMENGMRKYT